MKTYLLLLGLSTALSTGAPGTDALPHSCDRLIVQAHARLVSVRNSDLRQKVRDLLAKADKQCRKGKKDSGSTIARSVMEMIK
jgi:hypothetical protein